MASPASGFAQRHPERPVVVAHRGASALAPENTLAAIRLAAHLQAAAVEFDVHAAVDGTPVVIHDPTLHRTTNGHGKVRRQSLEALRRLSAGAWFSPEFETERIPLLSEVLEIAGSDMVLCIEIKTGRPIMERVAQLTRAADLSDRVVIFSFKPKQIVASKKHLPESPALLLFEPSLTKDYVLNTLLSAAQQSGADLIGLDHEAATAPLIQALQDAGFPVFVYTVNAAKDVARVVAMGVDGVITNHPRATLARVYQARPRLKQ